MREERMRELMQQELAVPGKVHDGFEKGIEQVLHMDMEQTGTDWKTGRKGRQGFWHRAGLVAAAVAAVCVISFHSQIYSFAKSLFIHEVVKMGEKEVAQEADVKCIKINDVELTPRKWQYFESLEDVGEKLGVSFLKSSSENTVTGKGRAGVLLWDDYGTITVADDYFVVNDISQISYAEGESHSHADSDEAYIISCKADFYTETYTETFQDGSGIEYVDGTVIEDYDTANGFHATLFRSGSSSSFNAVLYCDNIRYEYEVDDNDTGTYTVEDFKEFLDTLTK